MSLPGPNIEAKKEELLDLDIKLRRKQDIWEHPRNIILLVAAIAGALGFRFGRETPPPAPIIIQLPPNPTPPQH